MRVNSLTCGRPLLRETPHDSRSGVPLARVTAAHGGPCMILKRLSMLTVLVALHLSHVARAEAFIAPSGLTATPFSSNAVVLSWVGAGQDSSIVYSIERSLDATSGFVVVGATGRTSTVYGDVGLAPGTTYYYRVRVISGVTTSAYSNVARVTTSGTVTTTTLRTTTTISSTSTTSTTSTTLAQLRGPVASAG